VSDPGALRHLVLFNGSSQTNARLSVLSYLEFVATGERSGLSEVVLSKIESGVRAGDVLNLQFTSGEAGHQPLCTTRAD
jgi:hypothetical protein